MIEIKNYRSLEAVKLEHLGSFNVLIGRNNSGKSAVFGMLPLLNDVIRGQGSVDWTTVLTGQDARRSLEIKLKFDTSHTEREDVIRILWPGDREENRRLVALDSPLFRQVEFLFRSPAGSPQMFHLRETKIIAEDSQWASVQKIIGDERQNNPQSHFKQISTQAIRQASPVTAALLDVSGGRDVVAFNVPLNYVGYIYNQPREIVWPQARLDEYLKKAYFFNPFRHSEARQNVAQTEQLAQNGSNLAQVLHTTNSNNRPLFSRIEKFAQAALPDLGILQTPLRSNQTEVGFLSADGGYFVRLHDMGGGIEQLLMVATVLLTTGEDSALFIEEPESHLHAGAQRFLIERLFQGDRQVFLTTHSPTFVNLSRPSSMYQVRSSQRKTTIIRLEGPEMLGAMLADIGSRNSDVLLSNAVVFVEGPGDRDAFGALSKMLGVNLEELNVTVFPVGGGDQTDHKARVRSEVLAGISQKAPVPHLFVLDRDERSQAEVQKLQQTLGAKVHLLQRRELENYLLVPRALLAAIREKCSNDATVVQQIDQAKGDEILALIRSTADSLYGLVLLKRIRAELGGLPGGLLPRETATCLAAQAPDKELPQIITREIQQRLSGHLKGLDVTAIVNSQREALDKDWSNNAKLLELAPGEELLQAVFRRFGTEYKKPEDTVRIASKMTPDEIPEEIKQLIKKAVDLPAS